MKRKQEEKERKNRKHSGFNKRRKRRCSLLIPDDLMSFRNTNKAELRLSPRKKGEIKG